MTPFFHKPPNATRVTIISTIWRRRIIQLSMTEIRGVTSSMFKFAPGWRFCSIHFNAGFQNQWTFYDAIGNNLFAHTGILSDRCFPNPPTSLEYLFPKLIHGQKTHSLLPISWIRECLAAASALLPGGHHLPPPGVAEPSPAQMTPPIGPLRPSRPRVNQSSWPTGFSLLCVGFGPTIFLPCTDSSNQFSISIISPQNRYMWSAQTYLSFRPLIMFTPQHFLDLRCIRFAHSRKKTR